MLAPYRALLRLPGAPRLVAASLVGRLPYGMDSLGLLLFVREQTGGFASAGAVVAANLAAICLTAPVQGRLIDRVGQYRVLVPCAVVHAAALVVLVAVGTAGAPLGVVLGCAVLAGAFVPPLSPAARTLWPRLAERAGASRAVLDTAYAFEAVAIEVLFIVGPMVAALLIAVASPAACLLVAAGLALAGSVAFATAEASRTWRTARQDRSHWLGPLRSAPVRWLLVLSIPHGAGVGLIEVALPAYADGEGHRPLAGVLIAAWATGSLAGGLVYGARRHGGSPARRLVLLHAALACTAAPLLLGQGIWPMAALCLVCGLPLASTAACLYSLLAEVAPAGGETEANTWVISGIVAGLALGGLVGGALADDPGSRATFAAAAGIFAAAAAVALAGAPRLRRTPVRSPA